MRWVLASCLPQPSESMNPGPRSSVAATNWRASTRAIEGHRLVSIVGLGGCGKTRLALAAARRRERDGLVVYRVRLRPLVDPALVVTTIASVVVTANGADLNSLARALGRQPCLLFLDHCEHLLASCATTIAALLELAPNVRVLVSTREPLGVAGEHLFPLGLLGVPGPGEEDGSPSVELFVERVRAQMPSFSPAIHELRDIGGISRATGGLPLAIEIAAAQLPFGTTRDLLRSVSAPFDSAHTVDDPVALALMGVIDWTWARLLPAQQTLLARLSVFAGGCTMDGANAGCREHGSVAEELVGLVERNLITAQERGGSTRYEMLEPIREYAALRLAERHETNAIRDRLVSWLRGLIEPWSIPELHAWTDASAVLVPEQANVSASLAHLRDTHRSEEFVWFAVRACGMWINHGLADEIVRWLSPSVDDSVLTPAARCATAAGADGSSPCGR